MQIIITGAAGFLGQRLTHALLNSPLSIDRLSLVDIVMPPNPTNDSRVSCQQIDLSKDGAAKRLVTTGTGIIFHLAAVVSSHAEKEFDTGWKVNLDITRQLLEAIRHTNPSVRLVFSSSLAVYGGNLPSLVNDMTVVTPRSSYGIQKAIGELMLNDYSRKGFVDGLALRLPTICVRPGRPNLAASSFVSSIIREPLRGEPAVCPVSDHLQLFLSSPKTVIQNLMHAAGLDTTRLVWRTLNLPGITVSVREMLDSLSRIGGAAAVARVHFTPDEAINRIVTTWPGALDNTTALQLGFIVDRNFDDFVHQHIADSK